MNKKPPHDLYDGYIHTNGTLQVKFMPLGNSLIDQSSPFVRRYLQPVHAKDYAEAVKLLSEQIL